MNTNTNAWSKEELKVYILLLCAKADKDESPEEIDLIRSKTAQPLFDKVYRDFSRDNESACLEKIQDNLEHHHYSHMELVQLKKEIREIFVSDQDFKMKEQNLGRILDNILY